MIVADAVGGVNVALSSTLLTSSSTDCLLSTFCLVFSSFITQAELFEAFKELFQAATSRPPPYGICPYQSSRAIYAVDVMLKWSRGQNGKHSFKCLNLSIWDPAGRDHCSWKCLLEILDCYADMRQSMRSS